MTGQTYNIFKSEKRESISEYVLILTLVGIAIVGTLNQLEHLIYKLFSL